MSMRANEDVRARLALATRMLQANGGPGGGGNAASRQQPALDALQRLGVGAAAISGPPSMSSGLMAGRCAPMVQWSASATAVRTSINLPYGPSSRLSTQLPCSPLARCAAVEASGKTRRHSYAYDASAPGAVDVGSWTLAGDRYGGLNQDQMVSAMELRRSRENPVRLACASVSLAHHQHCIVH
jgi:hypothetical protein